LEDFAPCEDQNPSGIHPWEQVMSGSRQYTKVSRTSWGQRLMQSIAGVVGGIVLVLASIGGLWWNEGRAVNTAKGLKEGSAAVSSINADQVDPGNSGQLVHLSGQAVSAEVLRDPVLGVAETAIALVREVEMYQWREESRTETRTTMGGAEERVTTYSYRPEWSSRHIDSARFNQAGAHRNPAGFPIESETRRADNVTVGAFRLNSALIAQIRESQPFELDAEHAANLPEGFRERANADQPGWLYIGNPMMPEIGDMRIRLQLVRDQPVSLLARQVDNSFEPHVTSHGTTIQRLMPGTLSADAMFDQMVRENTIMTWAMRLGGIVLMVIGFGLILKPIRVTFDVLPILGSIAGAGIGLVSLISGLVLSLTTIGLAWLFYRPLLSIVLFAVCGGLIWFGRRKLAERKAASEGVVSMTEEPATGN
jgi:hypothetical protein